jgi:hypothetical protein
MAGGLFSRLFTRNTGGTISGPNDDSEFDNIISNLLPAKIDDYSATTGQMDSTKDPYPASSQSLATNDAEEKEHMRWQFSLIIGKAKWYFDPSGSLEDVFVNTATFAGKKTFTNNLVTSKGADVVAANALPIITDGNYFDVTGTTAITTIDAIGVGVVIRLHFDAILTLTHHSTNLILPSGANITTAAGDEATFVEYTAGSWRCTDYTRADGTSLTYKSGQTIQTVTSTTNAVATGSTVMAITDSIPVKTEGDEYLTRTITPKSASNKLIITIFAQLSAGAGLRIAGAIFQDTTTNALAAGVNLPTTALESDNFTLIHIMSAGTTSATTFKFRAGPEGAGTVTLNGDNGSRIFGGVCISAITIQEVQA